VHRVLDDSFVGLSTNTWMLSQRQRVIALCCYAFSRIPVEIRVLIDTDAFCKLATGELLGDALTILNVDIGQCGRLAALPYMLRKGVLPRIYGVERCSKLVDLAKSINIIPDPDPVWLDRLLLVPDIDIGEAQLFAFVAANSLLMVTGDKRALQALKDIAEYREAIAGRIIALEALLLALCDRLGPGEVRRRLDPVIASDMTVKVCFSPENRNPREALNSYYLDLVAKVRPLCNGPRFSPLIFSRYFQPDLSETFPVWVPQC
jgi:hypothetical protein